ncbi:GAF domain-containing SpoIIE family protein phosphatase [Jatrophihabitans sp. YIM 134969]
MTAGPGTTEHAVDPLLLPVSTPLPAASDTAFDRLASVVRRVIGVPIALVSLVDRDRQVFPGVDGLPEPWASSRTTPLSHSFCQHVVARAEPFVVTDAVRDPRVAGNLAVPDLGVAAYAGWPIVDHDGTVAGSLCAMDTEPRTWTDDELALLQDLAAAASAELQLRAAIEASDRAAQRWRVLSALSEALAAPTSTEEVAAAVSRLASTWLGASFGGITTLDDTGTTLSYVDLADDIADNMPGGQSFPVTSTRPSALAVARRAPLFVHSVEELEALAPGSGDVARAVHGTAFAYLPLQIGARLFGSLTLMWSTPQPFDEDERDLLLGLARYTAQALERASLMAERRDVARTLQTAMLPVLPEVGWLDVSGRYLPAHVTDAVGGDWFDAFTTTETPDGCEHLTVVVGDVTGHDTAAAAVMGRLQATLRALAVDVPDSPDRLLTRLDQVMARTGVDRMATAVAATVSSTPDGRTELTWSNAGHLAPLYLPPSGPAEYLERPVDILLGMMTGARRESHTTTLAPGSTVLLFTDGLVERRGQALDEGLDALAATAEHHRGQPLEEMLSLIVEVASAGGHEDDIVVFGLRVPDTA